MEKNNKERILTKREFKIEIGKKIKKLRRDQGLSYGDLADLSCKTRQYIHKIESGKYNSTAYILYEIAKGLDVPLKDLFDFE